MLIRNNSRRDRCLPIERVNREASERLKDKLLGTHPMLEQLGPNQFIKKGVLGQKGCVVVTRLAEEIHEITDSITMRLYGEYSLRINKTGLFGYKVDVISPTGKVIVKNATVIRGIGRTFKDRQTGWSTRVRISGEWDMTERPTEIIGEREG